MSWWNLQRLSGLSYRETLLDKKRVLSKIFAMEDNTENLFPFLMSFFSFDSAIFSLTNSLNFSGIKELTILNYWNGLLTNITYPCSRWILIALIFWHIAINTSMSFCKCKYFRNSKPFNMRDLNHFHITSCYRLPNMKKYLLIYLHKGHHECSLNLSARLEADTDHLWQLVLYTLRLLMFTLEPSLLRPRCATSLPPYDNYYNNLWP